MKISYRRTGGFAGMVISYDVDTRTLANEEAEEIQELIAVANFFGLPEVIPSDIPGADRFQYKLTVEDEEQLHTIEVGDAAVPEDLWPVLSKIRVLSRTTRN